MRTSADVLMVRPKASLASVHVFRAVGAVAVGAVAVGAASIGALAISRLAIKRAVIQHLSWRSAACA